MKNIVLIFIVLIAFYTLIRNNVGALPDQIIWNPSSDLFYKTFIPLLMLVSSIASLIKREKISYFYIAFVAMFIDAINRLALGVNHIYLYQIYKDILQPHPIPGSVMVVKNLWPSHIMLFLEVALIICTLVYLTTSRTSGNGRHT